MNNLYHIKLKDKNTGEICELYNDIFNPQNGVAFFQIDNNWELVFARRFTGIKVKDGKKLFEGDIVASALTRSELGYIQYSEPKAAFQIVWTDKIYKQIRGEKEFLFQNSEIVWEIAGNIYE